MIIISSCLLEVGKIYGPDSFGGTVFNCYGKITKQFKFKVMRIATKEEYIDYITNDRGENPKHFPFDMFYEISPD